MKQAKKIDENTVEITESRERKRKLTKEQLDRLEEIYQKRLDEVKGWKALLNKI